MFIRLALWPLASPWAVGALGAVHGLCQPNVSRHPQLPRPEPEDRRGTLSKCDFTYQNRQNLQTDRLTLGAGSARGRPCNIRDQAVTEHC